MKTWKSWQFGKEARAWPVIRDAAKWASEGRGTVRDAAAVARRHPSSAVPQTLETVLASPSDFMVKKRRAWDVVKYARLYTGETYPITPSFEFTLRDAWLHVPSGFVITADREVLGFSSHAVAALHEGHSACRLEDAPVIEQPAFKLSTVWGNNYAHWLMDGLPKADALTAGDSALVVLDKPSPRFQKESVDLLGLANTLAPDSELLRFRELRFVSCGKSGVPDPRPLLRVRDRLRQAAGKPAGPRRVYISRQRTRRMITNGEEVGGVLASFGFEEVFTEEMDFASQVRLFSGAEAIFGAHGAGTMNVLFAPAGSALIEAINPPVWDHAAHRVAALCGVRHYHLFAANASREFDVRIDARILEKTLALAVDPERSPRDLLVEKEY